ncbi:MAG: Signal transduction histidine kinase [Verrucomicrobia bacterium]|nr:MAG: Signal transduction histidine kinase [Verrucomicrobiota bacterium]
MRVFLSLALVAMLRRLSVVFTTGVLLLCPCLAADSSEAIAEKVVRLLSPEMRRLDAERLTLHLALPSLPKAPEPEFTQRLGWHSQFSTSADTLEWVDLRLAQSEALDAVVLIAPASGGGATGPGYGFPLRFRVEVFSGPNSAVRTIIADHTREDFQNPGWLPVVIPAHGIVAGKVRITATRLFQEEQRHLFALGEVMLLRGSRNLGTLIEAIGPIAVQASSSQGSRPAWGRINLVDGQSVLGPPLGVKASPARGFRSKPASESMERKLQQVSVDLGSAVSVDEVRLFPAHPPEFAHSHGYGFPLRYQIELRETAEATPFIVTPPPAGNYSGPPGDNVVTLVAGGQNARHIGLTVVESHVSNGSALLALAEMQVWSGGKNVALGKSVSASDSTETGGWSKAALVDGFTSTANILEWPEWLAGLSRRREVAQQVEAIEARKRQLVQQWEHYGLGALGVLIVTGLAAFIEWSMRQRRTRLLEMEALRQRIARDLHDEIGSSLGSIALITQDILASGGGSAQTHSDLDEIKHIADETVSAMRDITRLIQSDRYGSDDLATLLRETAARLLRNVPHTLTLEASEPARKLPVDRQRDLILMFKEGLYNVTRHAAATAVEIRVEQSSTQLSVTVHDNGHGFDPAAATEGMGLTNLQRRAAKHGGSVRIDSAPARGTALTINLPVYD